MSDISGVGLQVQIVASSTFPSGFNFTNFADDADPLDIASIKIAEISMGLNGELLSWAKAVPIPMIINAIPGSEGDINLGILAEANRVGRGKSSARDVITAVITYPDGLTTILDAGVITDAMVANSVASAGRKKSKPYGFSFENKTEN